MEQLFAEFYECAMQNGIPVQQTDKSPCKSFYNLCALNKPLTEKQANFVLRLLKKYQTFAESYGLEYEEELKEPQWQYPFRTIDTTKSVFVEYDEDSMPWVCFKFPYSIIQTFENAMPYISASKEEFVYDKDRKLRMAPIHDLNLIQVAEFIKSAGFETDTTFENYVSYAEEINNNIDDYEPHSIVYNSTLEFKNAPRDLQYQTKDVDADCFTAKSMAYPVRNTSSNKFDKVCSATTNKFWTTSWDTLFEVAERIPGNVAIVLNKTTQNSELKTVLTEIVDSANAWQVNTGKIKVCFRTDNKHNKEFNEWLAVKNLTGPVSDGKYFIFESKPAKWLFKNKIDVSIIATNTVYMHGNALTNSWFKTHPCVFYVTASEPMKEHKIVNL